MNMSHKGVLWRALQEHVVPGPLLEAIPSLCETLRTVFALVVLNQVFSRWTGISKQSPGVRPTWESQDYVSAFSADDVVLLASSRLMTGKVRS